jgi:glycosyltransferase involved in cell wall biosynthesis
MTDEASYKRLTVLVPVFDERNTVGEVVRRLRSLTLPPHLDLEVLVVDDGSTDGTDKVLRTIEDSTVRVVRHSENRGKGAAIRTGLAEARGDVVLLQDADLEYDPDDVVKMIEPILAGRSKVVYGSRFHPAREAMPLTTLLRDRALSVAACVMFNTTVTDVETGFKVFDTELLRSFDLQSDGFEIDAEVTAKVLRSKEKIFEVPVSYANRPAKRPGSKSRVKALQMLTRQRFTTKTARSN